MGGKGSGGARRGAGRKPKSRDAKWLSGNAGHRAIALVPPQNSNVQTPPAAPPVTKKDRFPLPPMLNQQEALYWQRWAPLADQAGLLTEERVPGMILLCEIAAARDATTSSTDWRDLTRQLGQHLARFGLTADGRVPEVAPAKPQDDEGQALARLLSIR